MMPTRRKEETDEGEGHIIVREGRKFVCDA